MYVGKAYKAAIRYANKDIKKKFWLKNLWHRQGHPEPVPATTTYVRKINSFMTDEYDKYWVRHEIDENHNYSIFSNSDKQKIMDAAIQQVFLIENLISYGYIKAYFPLHNEYELTGWVRDKEPNPDEIGDSLKECFSEEVYETIEKEDKYLVPAWKTGWKTMFFPPLHLIRGYFGEKIAYYFDFLTFYTRFLIFTTPVGFILFLLYFILDVDDTAFKVFLVLYAFINVFVTIIFIEYLKRREKSNAADWGMSTLVEEDIIRPLFRGVLRRSPIDDNISDPWSKTLGRL